MEQRKIKLYYKIPEKLAEDTIYCTLWTNVQSWLTKDFKLNVTAKSSKYTIKYTATSGEIHSGLEVKTEGFFFGDDSPKFKDCIEFIDDLVKQNEAVLDPSSYTVLIKQGLQYQSMVDALRKHHVEVEEAHSLL